MRYSYDLLRQNPDMTPAAGWLFELRLHRLLRWGDPIHLFPIRSHHGAADSVYNDYHASEDGKGQKGLQLPDSREHVLD